MSFIEWLKNIFSTKKRSILTSTDLAKIKGETTPLEMILTDKEDQPLPNETIYITINGKTYERTTNEQGIATININLIPGVYKALIRYNGNDTYNGSTAYSDINISANLEAEDLNMVQGDGSNFSVTTKDSNGEILPNTKVSFTINNKGYDKVSNEEGIASLTINLAAGDYKIVSSSVLKLITNNIHIEPAPEPKPPEPTPTPTSGVYQQILNMDAQPSNTGFAQNNNYNCGPNTLQCLIYYLTGIMVGESTLASVAGTTTSGTGHYGLNTAIEWFNRNFDPTLSIEWRNFGEYGFEGVCGLMEENNTAVAFHNLRKNQWGHYSSLRTINLDNNTVQEYNSLNGGNLENHSFDTWEQWLSGISQPSLMIVRRID